ncbi:MAG: hypothetical protein MI919_27245 [Holophagales bacterium]|nr:hypothetical protein [Holophagales bacterium]
MGFAAERRIRPSRGLVAGKLGSRLPYWVIAWPFYIKGSFSSTFETSAKATLGTGSPDVEVSPSGSISSKPTYDVAVLDTDELMRGITRPVSLETVHHYLQQGWPADLLIHLLVEKIEVPESVRFSADDLSAIDEGDERQVTAFVEGTRAVGTPSSARSRAFPDGSEGDKKLFSIIANYLARRPAAFRIDRAESKPVGPTLPAWRLRSLGDLIEVAQTELSLEETTFRGKKGFVLTRPGSWRINLQLFGPSRAYGTDCTEDTVAKVTLRSPHGILYYLGELARDALSDGGGLISLSRGEKLLVVEKRTSGESSGSYVEVQLDGETYFIPHNRDEDAADPASRAGRSMKCLAFVS